MYLSTRHQAPTTNFGTADQYIIKSTSSEEKPFLRTIIMYARSLIIDKVLDGFLIR